MAVPNLRHRAVGVACISTTRSAPPYWVAMTEYRNNSTTGGVRRWP
jgi:hypothetical protein